MLELAIRPEHTTVIKMNEGPTSVSNYGRMVGDILPVDVEADICSVLSLRCQVNRELRDMLGDNKLGISPRVYRRARLFPSMREVLRIYREYPLSLIREYQMRFEELSKE